MKPHELSGLEGAFFEHRERIMRFVALRGAGDAAEDVVQDVWLKISSARTGPVASPLAYLYRVANTVMIDRFRSQQQAAIRDHEWTGLNRDGGEVMDAPSVERELAARDYLRLVEEMLARLEPPRIAEIFRRHRVDGIPQKQVAAEFGVSLSTVESDLRAAYRALADLKERHDEA